MFSDEPRGKTQAHLLHTRTKIVVINDSNFFLVFFKSSPWIVCPWVMLWDKTRTKKLYLGFQAKLNLKSHSELKSNQFLRYAETADMCRKHIGGRIEPLDFFAKSRFYSQTRDMRRVLTCDSVCFEQQTGKIRYCCEDATHLCQMSFCVYLGSYLLDIIVCTGVE